MSFIRTTTTVFAAGLVAGFVGAAAAGFQPMQPDEDLQSITLTGVVRDFHERTAPAGHPDFERRPSGGFGLYCGNVATQLDADGKPVFSGSGYNALATPPAHLSTQSPPPPARRSGPWGVLDPPPKS